MKTKKSPQLSDYVTECIACGYAGFSHGTNNRQWIRRELPHTEEIVNGRVTRRYKVADLIEFKTRHKIATPSK